MRRKSEVTLLLVTMLHLIHNEPARAAKVVFAEFRETHKENEEKFASRPSERGTRRRKTRRKRGRRRGREVEEEKEEEEKGVEEEEEETKEEAIKTERGQK